MTDRERIRQALSGLHASGDTITEVLQMAEQNRRGIHNTRRAGRKALLIAAAAALVLALSVTALAYTGVIRTWYSGNTSIHYSALPSEKQALRDVGYAPVLLEQFSNGYAFAGGDVTENRLADEDDHTVEAFKSFSFDYEKDGDMVYLDQDRYDTEMPSGGEVIATVDGIDLLYSSYGNRFVAPDYRLTPEEQAAEEAGELVFSYGEDIPGVHVVQNLFWFDGETHYSFTQIDGALSPMELAAMAAELLAAK